MGLLDQVLGQVIGNMAGGRPTGTTQQQPAGPLGGLLGGAAGQYGPLLMALLALLANKGGGTTAGSGSVLGDILGQVTGHAPHGADPRSGGTSSGSGSVLGDILGQLTGRAAPGADPRGGGRYGQPHDQGEDEEPQDGEPQDDGQQDEDQREDEEPSRGPRRRGAGVDSGFLNSVGSLLDGPGGAAPRRAVGDESSGAPAAGVGLDGLLDQFRRNGRGDLIESWIGSGPNQKASPIDLEHALGSTTIDQLSRQTGLGRDDLLSQLSQALPQVIDKLTPKGRVPTAEEHRSRL